MSFLVYIPSDCYVLAQDCGKHVPEGASFYQGAGIEIKPPWWKVAYLVTRQAVTYNAPVASVPTKDNVRVQVDITLVFSISDPYRFVYDLGVLRFDEYLRAATDESIRMLVGEVDHSEILDVKGEFGNTMLSNLNDKFQPLGVDFNTVLITDVKLPEGLAKMRQNITNLRTAKELKEKDFNFRLKELEDESRILYQQVEKKNNAQMIEVEAKTQQAQIQRDLEIARLEERKQNGLILAQEEAKVALINADAENARAEKLAESRHSTQVIKAESEATAARTNAEQSAKEVLIGAEKEVTTLKLQTQAKVKQLSLSAETQAQQIERAAEAEAAEKRAELQGKARQAEAEAEAATAFAEMRRLDLEHARLDLQQDLASQGKVYLHGDGAADFVSGISRTLASGFAEKTPLLGEVTENPVRSASFFSRAPSS